MGIVIEIWIVMQRNRLIIVTKEIDQPKRDTINQWPCAPTEYHPTLYAPCYQIKYYSASNLFKITIRCSTQNDFQSRFNFFFNVRWQPVGRTVASQQRSLWFKSLFYFTSYEYMYICECLAAITIAYSEGKYLDETWASVDYDLNPFREDPWLIMTIIIL